MSALERGRASGWDHVTGAEWPGRRSRRRLILRTFATFAATVLALLVLLPWVETQPFPAESAIGTAPNPSPDATGAASESAGLPEGGFDSPGGPSPSPGSVTSSYTPASPVQSILPANAVAPKLNESATSYRYETVAGVFEISKATPFLVRYELAAGDLMVTASTFVVSDPTIISFVNPSVLNATDYRFQTQYTILSGPTVRGNVTITYEFSDQSTPKVAAELRKSGGGDLGLSWVSLTSDHFVANGTQVLDFGNFTGLQEVRTSDYTLLVVPTSDMRTWSRRLSLDWSDAHAGTAFVGPSPVSGLEGASVVVQFPAGMNSVDPILVGSSTTTYATEYAIQRKTFEYGGRYWAFWDDGSNIVYASSQFSYAAGANSLVWTSKMSTGSGAVGRGFDVDQRGGTVLVGYATSSLTQMNVMIGTISGTLITWYGPYVVLSWPPGDCSQISYGLVGAGVPSVAISTDGYFWVSFVWGFYYCPTAFYGYKVAYYRSADPGSSNFGWKAEDYVTGPADNTAVRLVPLSNGTLVSVTGTIGGSSITTRRYSPGGWGTTLTWDIKLPTSGDRGRLLSAIADAKDNVHIAFAGDNTNAPGIRYTVLHPDDTLSPNPSQAIDSTTGSDEPTLARDANGDLHAFWRYIDSSNFYHIRYTRQFPGSGTWAPVKEPWGSVQGTVARLGLTAGLQASNQVFLLWTQGISSPSAQFGSVPTPMNLGSQSGQPWDRQGLSPYQSYFQELSTYVSPGSGLLTIRQTDFALSGRNLNLEISRVFVTPRAFEWNTVPSPYLYEDYPSANLGHGWQLNFPWISSQYIHLWEGQMYVLRWDGDAFENHDGEHFLLKRFCTPTCTYTLYSKGGIRYDFDSSKQLSKIYDAKGNAINLYYTAGKLDYINDTIGRTVDLTYNGDGTLASIAYGLQTATYSYQTVGGLTMLASVKDALGRETRFWHNDSRNPYLPTTIRFPTLGKTVFTWADPAVQVGSDLWSFVVTREDTQNRTGYSLRANTFDYTVSSGKVTYVKVATYDTGTMKGSTIQLFDAITGRSTTIRRDALDNQLGKQVTWFSSGAVAQTDVYPGASTTPSQSTYAAYDDWGNLIYSRDAIGHEKFASYVNTRIQGGFVAPGRLDQGFWAGVLLHDDFEDRDIGDWVKVETSGTVSLDYSAFQSAPPALKIYNNGGATGSASATHTFLAYDPIFTEVTVRPEETNRMHYVLFDSPTTTRVYVSLRDNGYIAWWSGSAYTNLVPYQAKQWYRIGIAANSASSVYDIWVNGVKVGTSIPMPTGSSGTIDRIRLQASCTNCGSATMFVDSVKVMRDNYVYLTGLQPGQLATYTSLEGFQGASVRADSNGNLYLRPALSSFPYGVVNVYDLEGNLEYSSPSKMFWGGEWYSYVRPWKAFPTRSVSGFLRPSPPYVDDGLPCGSATGGSETWVWPTDNPLSGSKYHRSTYLTGIHQHFFQDATSPSCTLNIGTGNYFVQYINVPANEYPSEIMLQFRDTADSWNHRAFWGASTSAICAIWACSPSPARMGGLPTSAGRWIQLISRASDVGMDNLILEGWAYTLYGGNATWDFSALGGSEFGEIRISGLQPSWTAALYDTKGNQIAYATVPGGGTVAAINVYGAASKIRAFPFEGFYIITGGGSAYRSPVMSFWAGDTYQYAATDFYPNPYIDSTFPHDRLSCSMEYQTGRGASPQVPIVACNEYTQEGLLLHSKVKDGSSWRETTYWYDNYGQVAIVTDPKGNNVFYDHSATYSGAYVTSVRDSIGTIRRATYDPTTGWPLATKDGRGFISRTSYDAIGRPTTKSAYDLSPSSEMLFYDMEWTTEEVTPKMEDLSGDGNHGSIVGTTAVAGRFGMGRYFPDINSRISKSGFVAPSISSLTLSIWGKLDSLAVDCCGKVHTMFSDASQSPTTGFVFFFNDVNPKDVVFQYSTGSTYLRVSWTGVIPDTQWHHYAVTADYGSDVAELFIDGVSVGQRSMAGALAPPLNGRTLYVGSYDSGTYGHAYRGTLDEARVFSRALTSAEISSLYTNSYGLLSSTQTAYDDIGNVVTQYEPTTKPRRLHYDMETLLNSAMEDLSGHGISGGIGSGVSTGVSGKVGKATSFPGTATGYISTPASFVFPTQRFSVAFWTYPTALPASNTFFFGATSPTQGVDAIYGFQNNGVFKCVLVNAAGSYFSTPTVTLSVNSWTHVVCVFDGSTLRIYNNGGQQGSGTTFSGTPITARANFEVGDYVGFTGITGKIDEFQVFDTALTASEIGALFQGTMTGFYQKNYFDSLGRTTMNLRRDMFGALISWAGSAYNFQDKVVSSTLARNATATFTTTYSFDFLGRPTSVTYPGTAPPVSISYDDVNRIRTVVSENLRKVQYLYGLGGRLTAVREYYDATNYYTTSYGYDEVRNLLSVTNALNQVTRHAYDNLNRLTKTTYPDNVKNETYTYDEVGNLKTRTDRAGQLTTYGYDARYRLTSIDYGGTTPNPDISNAYDWSDNRITVTNYATNPATTVAYAYDGINRATSETETVSGTSYTVGYTFDAAGRVTQLTYPDSSTISYVYDRVGRTSQVKDGSTTYGTFGYTADDLTNNLTFGNGVVQSNGYNGRGWPTSIKATYQASTFLDLAYSSFDASGNILTIGGSTQQAQTFTYDQLDRLKTASGGFGSITYTYDAVGNRLNEDRSAPTLYNLLPNANSGTVQWSPSGCTANWDCVNDASSDGDSTYVSTTTVGATDLYDLPNLPDIGSKGIEYVEVTAVARDTNPPPPPPPPGCPPNCPGASPGSDSTTLGSGATPLGTDDRIYLRVNGFRGSYRSLGYTYGTYTQRWTTNPATGQPWTAAEVNALQAGVEAADVYTSLRVTQLSVNVKVFDGAVYSYSNGPTGMNELASVNRNGALTTLTYDLNGNLKTKSGGWDYGWNPDNLIATAKQNSAQVQAYTYDGLGRRVKVDGTSGSAWTVSIVSGTDTIYEKDNLGAVTKYVYANGMRIAKINPDGTVYYYLGDHLGSTRKVLKADRTQAFGAEYEPFGKPYSVTGTEAYTFTSEKHDDPTGLVYLRARQYDPEIGRFVSADPFLGSPSRPQTLNRYVYVVNNPMRFIDPTGEACSLAPWDWGSCASDAASAVGNAASAVGNWWDNLDPNWKTAIVFGALTVLVIVTAGAAAPLVGLAASGIVSTMISGALVAGTVSGLMYAGTQIATGQEVTLSGFFSNFATGAFLGAVGSVAGMAGGSIAKAFDLGIPAAKGITAGIIAGTSVATDIVQSQVEGRPVDPASIAIHAGISLLGASASERFFPTKGMTTFNQASQGFAPSLKTIGGAIISPGTAGRNARSLLYGPMFESEVMGFADLALKWYSGASS